MSLSNYGKFNTGYGSIGFDNQSPVTFGNFGNSGMGGNMKSGGFDFGSLAGAGVGAVGSLLGGLFEDDAPPPSGAGRYGYLSTNPQLALYLMMARKNLGNIKLPGLPSLPTNSFANNLASAKLGR